MKMWKTIVMSLGIIECMLINLGMAADYTVGDPDGEWDQSTDLQTWASSKKFSVGDNLLFSYTPNHDVTEVSKPDFDTCTVAPLRPPFTGGSTVIPLTSAGKRYFICGTSGHCLTGMKMEIDVLPASAPPPSTPTPPPPTTTPLIPPPQPSTTPSVVPTASPPMKPPVSPSPKNSHSPKVSPSLSPSKAPKGTPVLPPAAAPTPSGSLTPPPPPSSASKFNVRNGFTASWFGFLLMMFLI